MAKMVNCACCGKELKAGSLFKDGENKLLTFSSMDGSMLSGKDVICCEDCYNKYSSEVEFAGTRFYTKIANAYSSAQAVDGKKWMQIFDAYRNEERQQAEKVGEQEFEFYFGPFACNSQGYFLVQEQDMKEKSLSAENNLLNLATACATQDAFAFTKDDITKIEYQKIGIGQPINLFKRGYSFNIYLNDEKVLTYKPCVARSFAIGKGFGFGYYKSAEKALLAQLEDFKRTIGSNLPVKKRGLF